MGTAINSHKARMLLCIVLAAVFGLATLGGPREATAITAFAQQTGFECNICHSQYAPKLNAYGRSFKIRAHADMGANQDLITGKAPLLASPVLLHFGFVTKIFYVQPTEDTESDRHCCHLDCQLGREPPVLPRLGDRRVQFIFRRADYRALTNPSFSVEVPPG